MAQIFYLKNRSPDEWSDRTTQEVNINLKEVLRLAKGRLEQHNLNERIIEGEVLDHKRIEESDRLANNKKD